MQMEQHLWWLDQIKTKSQSNRVLLVSSVKFALINILFLSSDSMNPVPEKSIYIGQWSLL
jgi:hypothetical protein